MLIQESIKSLVHRLLLNPETAKWTIQGLGMLRTYLPGSANIRLHIWDSSLVFPNVSVIHSHPWDFESYIVCGNLTNYRLTEGEGLPYLKHSIKCGTGGCILGVPEKIYLHCRPSEIWTPGRYYGQEADEIHYTEAVDGTITLIRRNVPEGRSADMAFVYYTEDWISAEPREATEEEIETVITRSLNNWF